MLLNDRDIFLEFSHISSDLVPVYVDPDTYEKLSADKIEKEPILN